MNDHKPDVVMLRRVMTHIKDHPETWHQGSWRSKTECGTRFCFAGWAVEFAEDACFFAYEDGYVSNYMIMYKDDVIEAEIAARKILGISYRDAENLFNAGADIDELEDIVDQICADASHRTQEITS